MPCNLEVSSNEKIARSQGGRTIRTRIPYCRESEGNRQDQSGRRQTSALRCAGPTATLCPAAMFP